MMRFDVRPTDREDARQILHWQYDPPYELYNSGPHELEGEIVRLAEPTNGYYSVRDEQGRFVAFMCFGEDAQVPGGDYSRDVLDIGCGIRPDLTGQGMGPSLIQAAVDFGVRTYQARSFRATIAAFNERALKASQTAGFVPTSTFDRTTDGLPFVILECARPD
jgi:[ribosomal protein S18]-alanine N-acetyltransferase